MRRLSSPPLGFSTLITFAPMSASTMVHMGPASICVRSITTIPAKGPLGGDAVICVQPRSTENCPPQSRVGAHPACLGSKTATAVPRRARSPAPVFMIPKYNGVPGSQHGMRSPRVGCSDFHSSPSGWGQLARPAHTGLSTLKEESPRPLLPAVADRSCIPGARGGDGQQIGIVQVRWLSLLPPHVAD